MLKILSVVFIATLTGASPNTSPNNSKPKTVANSTSKKIVASSAIPEKREFPLNPDVNPCENFHQYVCSQAEASFKLREDRSHHVFAFSDSNERLLEAKKSFMKELPQQKNLDVRTSQVRDFYLSCMDVAAKKKNEKLEVTRRAAEVDALKSFADLVRYSHAGLPQGAGSLLSLWAGANQDDPKKMNGMLFAKFMLLPDHKYYDQAELMKEYEKLVALFFQNAYPGLKKAEAVRRAQAMIALEKDFAKVYPITSARRQRWSEKRVSSQADLIKKYPQLQLELVFKDTPKDLIISTPIPEALDFLNSELSVRPLQVWQDIYLYKTLSEIMDDSYKNYFNAGFKFEQKFFGGPKNRPDRQERCTSLATDYFVKEIDAALVDKIFPNFNQDKINEVGVKIRQSIIEGIDKNTWLSRSGKKEATAKIKNARLQMVKPQNDREWDFVPQRTYDPQNFIQNLKTFNEARWERNLQELREPANQDAWGMGPLTVNAYYSPSENKFVMPIGILQYPFFNQEGTIIENLGAVGAVIGHELGHSIDDNGSKYDSEGRLKQWMSTKEVMEFNLRGQKMIDQFNSIGHDGKLTLGENVADLVGLTFAYNAAFPKGQGSREDKQKFFIAQARVWCSVTRPEYAQLLLKTDSHAAGWARINEQVKHQVGFAEAFQCKAGDKMTLPAEQRVQIW